MNKKQNYIAPKTRSIEMEVHQVLANSKELYITDITTDDDAIMSEKKKAPWTFTWE